MNNEINTEDQAIDCVLKMGRILFNSNVERANRKAKCCRFMRLVSTVMIVGYAIATLLDGYTGAGQYAIAELVCTGLWLLIRASVTQDMRKVCCFGVKLNRLKERMASGQRVFGGDNLIIAPGDNTISVSIIDNADGELAFDVQCKQNEVVGAV